MVLNSFNFGHTLTTIILKTIFLLIKFWIKIAFELLLKFHDSATILLELFVFVSELLHHALITFLKIIFLLLKLWILIAFELLL